MISLPSLIRAANLDDIEPRIERWGAFRVDRRKYDVIEASGDGGRITVAKKSLAMPTTIGTIGLL